jgi:hypothetical protein
MRDLSSLVEDMPPGCRNGLCMESCRCEMRNVGSPLQRNSARVETSVAVTRGLRVIVDAL